MNLYFIPSLLSFLSSLSFGLYILKQNPRRLANLSLGLGALVLSALELSVLMVLYLPLSSKTSFWVRFGIVSTCFIPILWTLTTLTFARANYPVIIVRWKWYLFLVSFLSLLFLYFLPSPSFIRAIIPEERNLGLLFGSVGHYFHLFLLLSLVVVIFNLEHTYREAEGEEKFRIKYAIIGLISLFAFHIYVISVTILYSSITTEVLVSRSLATMVSLLLLSYAILRYKLLDSQLIISRQVVYTSFTIIAAGIYLIFVGLVGKLAQVFGGDLYQILGRVSIFTSLLFMVIVLSSRTLRRSIRSFVDENFYRYKYDYRREWVRFNERTGAVANLNDLCQVILEVIHEVIDAGDVSLLLLDETGAYYRVVLAKNSTGDIRIPARSKLVQWLNTENEPIDIGVESKTLRFIPVYLEVKEELDKLGTVLCVPLRAKGKLVGMLSLGNKGKKGKIGKLKERFEREDLVFLKTIASQAAIAIQNAKLSEEVSVAREMEHFYRLSSFITHDLKNATSMLSMVLQNAEKNFANPEFQKDALKAISDTTEKIKGLVAKLSALPQKLDLHLQPTDLNSLAKEAIGESKIREMGQVRLLEEYGNLPAIELDYDYIKKVILNLILNAIESLPPQGGTIGMMTAKEGKVVSLSVADTGCGIPKEFINDGLFKPFRTTKKKGLGIGLYQCKNIVESHGGVIEVESKVGVGSRFTVKLPIEKGYKLK